MDIRMTKLVFAILVAAVMSCGIEPSGERTRRTGAAASQNDSDKSGDGVAKKKEPKEDGGKSSEIQPDDCTSTAKKKKASTGFTLAEATPDYSDVSPVIKKYCASCHSGQSSPNIATYAQLSRSIDSVIGSIQSGRMPRGAKKLTSDEKDLLVAWRAAGTPEFAEATQVGTDGESDNADDDDETTDGESDGDVADEPEVKDPCKNDSKKPTVDPQDLALTGEQADKLIAADAGGANTVYVTFQEMKDSPDFARDLEVYRFGVTKAMNHLSIKPDIVKMKALDPAGIVNALDLSALGLTQRDIDTMMKAPDSAANVRQVGSSKVINGDWMVFAATRPEVYDVILRIPNSVGELEKQLGADRSKAVTAELKPGTSEIVFGRRVLERIPMSAGGQTNGYYWRSYDYVFNSSDGLVAGEMLYSLPNGLQGYMLIGFATQHRWDAQPFVATDFNRPADGIEKCAQDGSGCGYVINGESCITCHADGIKTNENFFDFQGAGGDQFKKLMAQDTKRFTDAVAAMGFEDPGVEPVLETIKAYRTRSGNADKREGGGEVAPVAPRGTIWNRK